MPEVNEDEHDSRELVYRVRIEVVAQVVDRSTGAVVASGDEESMKELYRFLKRRES